MTWPDMRYAPLRLLIALTALLMAALGQAGTLTVLTPTDGGFLGLTNTIAFNITGASRSVKVTAVATPPSGQPTTVSTTVNPNPEGNASGSLALNFNSTTAEGTYTIVVTAEEAGATYEPTTLTETLDVSAPKFTSLSPVNGAFTRGQIKIRAVLDEANLDTYQVKIGNEVVATGSETTIATDYDSSKLASDGPQTITITATDRANNVTTRTILLNVDRQAPTVQIQYPTNNLRIAKGRDVSVIVDITDASATSVDKTGIDIQAKRPDGSYIARVTLVSVKGTSGTTQRWTGRIRYTKNLLPSQFKISVNVIDKAGNVAPVQEVTLRYN